MVNGHVSLVIFRRIILLPVPWVGLLGFELFHIRTFLHGYPAFCLEFFVLISKAKPINVNRRWLGRCVIVYSHARSLYDSLYLGASTAYYINKFKEPNLGVNITVYERSDYVGGRSTTVNVFNDPLEPVELGASIFVKANKNLVSAAEQFGLITSKLQRVKSDKGPSRLGIWDGKKFVFIQDDGGYYWWNVAKLILRYGLSPIRTQSLMKKTVGSFLKMYEEPYFPFRSLSQVAYDLGLTQITSTLGSQYLLENQIEPLFSTDIIQASTRVNYGQNLGEIHGLETMVCMATDGAMAVEGGNWQIFANMLADSGARKTLNTSVSEILRREGGAFTVISHTPSMEHVSGTVNSQSEDYDVVVIAAPLQFSNISIDPVLPHTPDRIPYVQLHVTLFTSPHKLAVEAFGLTPGSIVPNIILTTLPNGMASYMPEDHVGPAGFFSISTLRTVANPRITPPRIEYLYKVFSPEPVTDTAIARLFGIADSKDGISPDDVSWKYEKAWHSYPYLHPRVTFEEPELAPNLWYTSGIESFISTMETSSLMGMNVARLIVDDWESEGKDRLEI